MRSRGILEINTTSTNVPFNWSSLSYNPVFYHASKSSIGLAKNAGTFGSSVKYLHFKPGRRGARSQLAVLLNSRRLGRFKWEEDSAPWIKSPTSLLRIHRKPRKNSLGPHRQPLWERVVYPHVLRASCRIISESSGMCSPNPSSHFPRPQRKPFQLPSLGSSSTSQ